MHKKHILPLLLLVQIILVKIIAFFPVIVEEGYSKGLYLTITFITRNLFGFFPFSVGDIMYYVLIFLLLRWIWNHRKGFWNNWKNNGLTILSWFSIFYFFFHFLWGLNYYRVPLHEKLNIDKEYSLAELEAFTQKMIAQTNAVQLSITQNDSVVVVVPYSDTELFELAQKGYTKLPEELSDFKYQYKSVKASLFSYPLSYMGFGGYLNPFTNEAQVNYLIPKNSYPATVCHEIAHQLGIASEKEANFIAYFSAINSEDPYVKYAGYTFATRYCYGDLLIADREKAIEMIGNLNLGIVKNIRAVNRFWMDYKNPLRPFIITRISS